MKRRQLLVFGVLVAAIVGLVLPAVGQAAAPTITRSPISFSLEDDTDCGFPVFLQSTGTDINITWTLADGTVRSVDVFTNAKLTVTNLLDPSKSVTVSQAGPGHTTFNPDGSATFIGTGPAVFFLGFPFLPGIHSVVGRWVLSFDASGNPTFRIVGGTVRDLCAAVA